MSFISPIIEGGGAELDIPPPLLIARSLRFNSLDAAYVWNASVAAPTDRDRWTFSAWVKRSKLGAICTLMSAGGNSGAYNNFAIQFAADDTLRLYNNIIGAWISTTQKFKDQSEWYHVVVGFDSFKTTGDAVIEVNGVVLAGAAANSFLESPTYHYAMNYPGFNRRVGADYTNVNTFDGLMADVHFIDGAQLTSADFGQADPTSGQWVPKKYTGAYGANGFHLDFSDNSAATAAALGKDSSGAGNNMTPVAISVAAGGGNDSLTDTPTSNFAVLSREGIAAEYGVLTGALDYTAGTNTSLCSSFPMNQVPATSYSNTGGSGARAALITSTSSWVPANGSAQLTVDGSFTGNGGSACQMPGGSATGVENMVWDFAPLGCPVFMDEVKASSNGNPIPNGVYEYWDGAAWQAASAVHAFVSGALVPITMPATGTTKLRWRATSGAFASNAYWTEQEFKLKLIQPGRDDPAVYYFEMLSPGTGGAIGVSVVNYQWNVLGWATSVECPGVSYHANGSMWSINLNRGTFMVFSTAGDVVGCAFQPSTGKVWFRQKDGTWAGGGDPVTLTTPTWTLPLPAVSQAYVFGVCGTTLQQVNFGQRPFTHGLPAGCKRCCAEDLPAAEAVITAGSFQGNADADGPVIVLNGVPSALTIDGNAVVWGTHARKLSYGAKIIVATAAYNSTAPHAFTAVVPTKRKYARAQAA